jgi:Pyruvate/2-oxoacid:ferredoxin oxidoreductase delta subunit
MVEEDVYRRLQERLDDLPVRYPRTESGVELRLLRLLFTPGEAEIALALSAVPEPIEVILARLPGRDPSDLERDLDRMVEKGSIFGGRMMARAGRKRYSRAPLVIGMYEAQVDRITKELQREFDAYGREGFAAALLDGPTKQMRTVPVNARFVPDRQVGRYDDARRIVAEGPGPFAARNCVCRQGRDALGEPCRVTSSRRVCLMLGRAATSSIAAGDGEPLTREATLALLDQAEREGLVLQPANAQDPVFICLCCGCCCGMLRAAKQFPRPAEYLQSNYHVAVDGESCGACDACRARCPMEALRDADGVMAVDLDRCIGCGVCVPACPTEALRLVPKGRPAVPPHDLRALYGRLTLERFGVLGTAKRLALALMGRRI